MYTRIVEFRHIHIRKVPVASEQKAVLNYFNLLFRTGHNALTLETGIHVCGFGDWDSPWGWGGNQVPFRVLFLSPFLLASIFRFDLAVCSKKKLQLSVVPFKEALLFRQLAGETTVEILQFFLLIFQLHKLHNAKQNGKLITKEQTS
jgi:hypothetical protein